MEFHLISNANVSNSFAVGMEMGWTVIKSRSFFIALISSTKFKL